MSYLIGIQFFATFVYCAYLILYLLRSDLRFELKFWAMVVAVFMIFVDLATGDYYGTAIWALNWFIIKFFHKDDDDRWKKRRKKAAGVVRVTAGKLVVVPMPMPAGG